MSFDGNSMRVFTEFSDVCKNVFPFLVLWVMANYAFGQSLGRISASAASSIMSSNTAMVCVLSSLLIHERFTIEKVDYWF